MDAKKLKVARDCYPELDSMTREQLIEALANEIHDVRFISGECSKVYMAVTGDRCSKPMTYADAIIALHEDEVTKLVEDHVKDAIRHLEEANTENEKTLTQLVQECANKDDEIARLRGIELL